jgi:RNA recognition motif-containing protein
MAKRLYVGGLSYGVADDELRSLFTKAGTVESANVVSDRDTGRSRGFGFVEMATDTEAENAIHMFDGYNMEGRQLKVSLAQERQARGTGGGGGRGNY